MKTKRVFEYYLFLQRVLSKALKNEPTVINTVKVADTAPSLYTPLRANQRPNKSRLQNDCLRLQAISLQLLSNGSI